MENLRIATPAEVRSAIDSIPSGDFFIPHPTKATPNRIDKVNGDVLKVTDMLALVGGFRIDEIAAKTYGKDKSTANTLKLETVTHHNTGQEALLIHVDALKKKAPETREIGIPLDPHSEPYSKQILDAWEKSSGNPCEIDRRTAWAANRIVFAGLGYKVKGRVTYLKDEDGKLIRDAEDKKIIETTTREHPKPGSDHFLRHIRVRELRQLQFTRDERIAFFRWSTTGFGGEAMLDTYDPVDWFEWFPKLLKRQLYA